MAILREINLDLSTPQQFVKLTLQQGEGLEKQIDVQVFNNGDIFEIPSNAICSIRAINSKGVKIDDACTVVDGKIRFTITQTMTQEAERLPVQIKIILPSSGGIIKTIKFHMLIESSIDIDDLIITTGSYTQLDNALLEVNSWETKFDNKIKTYTYTATSTVSSITHNLPYDSVYDDLVVVYHGIILENNINYTNTSNAAISLSGWTISSGDSIYFKLYKNVK